jgi:hypothetical protein
MWTFSCLVEEGQIGDSAELEGYQLTVTATPPLPPRQLLVQVLVTEDDRHTDAYSMLTVYGLQLDHTARTGSTDLQPLLALVSAEQRPIRDWLVRRRWPAWARAALPVRALVGDATPPMLLAEAARAWMVPLATLTSAAAQDRLPTIHVGDRQLVYSATIAEAQERKLLHMRRGRPG